jgi:hypothetical protein
MKAIVTKYISATNTRGSRIAASDEDGNKVTIPYPHELSGEAVHRRAAEALCAKMGWHGRLASGSLKHGYVFVFTRDAVTHCIARDCGKPFDASIPEHRTNLRSFWKRYCPECRTKGNAGSKAIVNAPGPEDDHVL